MPSLSPVRTAIVNMLLSINNIGQVHSYERYSNVNDGLQKFYLYGDATTQHIRGWYVKRTQVIEGEGVINPEKNQWIIRGFMGLQDANQTELIFNDLIDLIRDAFRDDYDLGGLVSDTRANGNQGIQVDDITPAMFAGVLCHTARLSLWTRGGVSVSDNNALDDFVTFKADHDLVPSDGNVDANDEVTLPIV